MPPVGWAGGLATGAEHAFIEAIKVLSFFYRLEILFLLWQLLGLPLEEGIDGFILSIEMRHVNDEVLENEHHH